MDGYPIVNSMVIRQLLGNKRSNDTRPVDQEDLSKAIKSFNSFYAFVPMEHLSHPNVRELLNKNVPEYLEGRRILNARRQSKQNTRNHPFYNPDKRFLARITRENEFDILVYQYVLDKLGIS
jgi:hypothetical protein